MYIQKEKRDELDTSKTRQTPLQARASRLTLVVISHIDTKYPQHEGLGIALFLNPDLEPQTNPGKNVRQILIEGHSIKYLTSNPHIAKGIRNKQKS
jgi:hypothetical protein